MAEETNLTNASALEYLDFEVEIGPGSGGQYPVAVRQSPAGRAHATMQLPFDTQALDNRLKDVEIALLHSGGGRRKMPQQEELAVQSFGQAVFDALFVGDLRSRYDASLADVARQGKGLRITLQIEAPELTVLPWEFLYDSRQGEYVGVSRYTSIVRSFEQAQGIEPFPLKPPLRILGMVASPKDQEPLDVQGEKRRVEEAVARLRQHGLVELSWLPGQTWRDLQRAMRTGPWHVFHFIGHGKFEMYADEGVIALADDDGLTHLVRGIHLGRVLADHRSLRLVLLNSCEGGRESAHDLFSSTAANLLRRGIPAVVAMQYEITDTTAIAFSRDFYEALAEGLPIDAAVNEARKALSVNTLEWGAPVLYLRASDGRIFDVEQKESIEPPPPPPPSENNRKPQPLWKSRKVRGGVAAAAIGAVLLAVLFSILKSELPPSPKDPGKPLTSGSSPSKDAGSLTSPTSSRSVPPPPDVNAQNPKDGETALSVAATNGDVATVNTLLSKGAAVDARRGNGETALITAVWHNKTEVVKMLVEAGANVNVQSQDGQLALRIAIDRGNVAMVRTLLTAAGADVNAQSKKDGETALITAVWHNKTEVVKMLVEAGADVNAKSRDGESALAIATRQSYADIVDTLLKATKASPVPGRLLSASPSQTSPNEELGQALIAAVAAGSSEKVKALLAAGADVNTRGSDGESVLIQALRNPGHGLPPWSSTSANLEVEKVLLEAGADVNAKSKNGESALTIATKYGSAEMVSLLLQAQGSSPEKKEMTRSIVPKKAEEQYQLGERYYSGKGETRNYAEAAKLYQLAAEQGHAEAQFRLGELYTNGWGVAKEEAEAKNWFSRAATQKETLSLITLGRMYFNGWGVTKDLTAAFKTFHEASDQGQVEAFWRLGNMYLKGWGVAKEEAEAVRWYRKAAEQGNADGQACLGEAYANSWGVAKDEAEAAKWLRRAAEQGHASAQYDLGLLYANGWGVQKDEAEAVRWYRKAADQGKADAQNNLGAMYAKGLGIQSDSAEAVRWYRKAAEQGHAMAQNNLGAMYRDGNGVAQDYAEAEKWMQKAADQGYEGARQNLKELELRKAMAGLLGGIFRDSGKQ
ncbi:MAG: SEL1-like repeat protein [Deltaproteobacteria bacterium]|nr:SEL1-like repeat protein [Deltaproteobacteria bacterium]